MANLITADPKNFMSNLKKAQPIVLSNQKPEVIQSANPIKITPEQFNLGIKAKNPAYNVPSSVSPLKPNQVQAPAVSSPKTFNEQQNTGLLAALSRQKAGTANPEDTKNLQFAQSKGWKATITSPEATTTPIKPIDTTSKGLLTSLAETSKAGNQGTLQAQTGLLEGAKQNLGTSGQAYNDYQTAIDELQNLKNKYAEATASIDSSGIPLEFQQGRKQVLYNQYASMLDAAQQKVNQAQNAINLQISGGQLQQAGLTGAGNIGTTAQGLTQSGLGTAAGLAQPIQLPYGTQYINPQTGESIGNAGGDMNSIINYWADQIANNKASLADVPATITGAPNLKTQLQQSIQSKNPNYNPSVQGAGQQTAANLTAQTSQLQASLNGAEANFSLLVNTAQQGGVNDTSVPVLNTLINNAKFGLTSDIAVNNFRSTLATVRSQYAAILGGGTVTVDSQNRAQVAIPDNISLDALKSLEIQMKQEAQNRIAGNQQQINSLTGGSNTSAGSSIWNW